MISRQSISQYLPLGFGVALLSGILVEWSPRYWPTTVEFIGLSLVAALWAIGGRASVPPLETLLVVPVCGWALLQLAFHSTVAPWMTMRVSLAWIMCAVAFTVGAQILRGARTRRAFLTFVLWSMTALAADAMLQANHFPVKVFGLFPAESSVVGTMFYKNHFAVLMELGAPIALWRVRQGNVLSGGVCYAAMFAAVITSASRTGTILVFAELLVFLVVMAFERRLPVKATLATGAVLMLFAAGASQVAGTRLMLDRLQEKNPYLLRRQFTNSTLHMIAERPLFGFGMGTWPQVYPRFATLDAGVVVNEAHNDIAQWAAEGGIPFLVLIAALVLWLGKRAFESLWGLGLLAVIVHCGVDYSLRIPALSLLWFSLAGAVSQLRGTTARS